LPGTFGVSLTDRDEGFYAQVTREMLATGDWLMPRFLGEPWLFKPPLLYWCAGVTWLGIGPHVWAARLVSVLAALGALHVLASLAADLYGRRAGYLAAIVFISAGMPILVGKLFLTDGLLLLMCTAAALCLYRIAARAAGMRTIATFWLVIGFGLLTKGPAIIPFVGACGLGLFLRRQWRRPLLHPRFWLLAPLALLVAAPWYIYVAQHAGEAFSQRFVMIEILARIFTASCGHGGPPGYYLLTSFFGWLPWTMLLPAALLSVWRARQDEPTSGLLLIWAALPWLLLELMQSKLPHYVLPCYVPLAIILGRWIDLTLADTSTRSRKTLWRVAAAPSVVLGAALAAAGVIWWGSGWAPAAIVAGGLLALCFVAAARAADRGHLLNAGRLALGGTILLHVLVGLWLLPALEPYRVSRLVADRVNALAEPSARVLVTGYEEPSQFFYMKATARTVPPSELASVLAGGQADVLVAREEDLRAAGAEPPAKETPDWRRVAGFNYAAGKNVVVWIVRLNPPATRAAEP
jgi:4-amino-4-deoxy-L-arabinose transferase-like glycosyltransferase